MAVFALEGGRLVAAQSFDLQGTEIARESLAAIRERVIDLVEASLFPVAWQKEPSATGTCESLVALDATGQIVTVEVLERLDSDELLSALARAGRHGDIGRAGLASIYGPGASQFSGDWRTFLDACEPHPAPGPRLFLVVLAIDPSVRPAVDALAGAGLQVRIAALHDAGSQILVSFEEVKPRGSAFHSIVAKTMRPGIVASAESPEFAESSEFVESPEFTEASHEPLRGEPAREEFYQGEAEAPGATGGSAAPEAPSVHGAAERREAPVSAGDSTVAAPAATSESADIAPATHAPAVSEGHHAVPVSVSPDSAASAFSAEEAVREAGEHAAAGTLRGEHAAERPASEQELPEQAKTSHGLWGRKRRSRRELRVQEHNEHASEATPVAATPGGVVPTPAAAPMDVSARDSRSEVTAPAASTFSAPAARSTPSVPAPASPARSPESKPAPRPHAPRPSISSVSGPSAFAQSIQAKEAERRRLEQLIWEKSAPREKPMWVRPGSVSESAASDYSSDAVAMAADSDYRSSAGRLLAIARRYSTPFTVVWRQRRRGVNVQAEVTAWGTIVLANGAIFTDPSLAAQAASGIEGVDGWRVWKLADGRSLGEL